MSFSPTMIQDTAHCFSFEEKKFLNRGPSYVPPCQIHLCSIFSLSIHELVMKQWATLERQLMQLWLKFPIDPSRGLKFQQQLKSCFADAFVRPIPEELVEHAKHQRQLVYRIQNQLRNKQLILRRTADDMNTYYLGCSDEYDKKSNDYMDNSMCYECLGFIDETHTKEQYLIENIFQINSHLENLYQTKLISEKHREEFKLVKAMPMSFPYLCFLPNTNTDVHMTVEPKFSSYHYSPIEHLAKYLDQLIRPFVDQAIMSTTFFNSGDFMDKFYKYYRESKLFQPKTQFATLKIHDLYTNISHSSLLNAFSNFLMLPWMPKDYNNLSRDGILELTALVLNTNYFTYERKLYRFLRGVPTSLSLMQLLVSIYVLEWQRPLRRTIQMTDMFYGRYHDTIFLTWNESTDQLQTLFDNLEQELDTHLEMNTFIGNQVQFLHAWIENQNGCLYTNVYHDCNKQLFLLPYCRQHPRLYHRQWFHAALLRAGHYCCTLDDFQEERRYIELTFLANGYTLDFVEDQIKRFYSRFNLQTNETWIFNRLTYISFRQQLFAYVDQQKQAILIEHELSQSDRFIQLYYRFDWGLRWQFNEKFFQLWCEILSEDVNLQKYGLKIDLTTKHCYSSNTLLAPPAKIDR